MINIKIAKAYRTISFEASCMMAGFSLTGIVMEGKVRLYKIKHNAERSEYECHTPLPVKEWPHPTWQLIVMETSDRTLCRDLYRQKQNRRQSRSRSSLICGPSVEKALQIQAAKQLFKHSSQTISNLEVTGRTNVPFRPQHKKSSHLY
jgi:hypothetical protein